jgi:acyl phosphate:glycerol-3-phosphate acyltransferase
VRTAAVLFMCYFIGAVPIGLIVGKLLRGIDIRDYGSGNIGATNVLRLLGPGPAAIVFIGDALKGLLPVLLCKELIGNDLLVVVGGMLAVIGHNFSMFLRFRGGKGVATSLGVIIGVDPVIAAIAFGIWVTLVAITRYVSIASIIASITVPLQMWLSVPLFNRVVPNAYLAFSVIAVAFILVKHRSNVARLLSGTEPKIGQKA